MQKHHLYILHVHIHKRVTIMVFYNNEYISLKNFIKILFLSIILHNFEVYSTFILLHILASTNLL